MNAAVSVCLLKDGCMIAAVLVGCLLNFCDCHCVSWLCVEVS